MLSLDEKRSILHSFHELREKEDQYGRFFYYYDASPVRKKLIAYEFSHTGNGYVYGQLLPEYKNLLYKDGSVCVKDYTSEELKEIVRKSILSLQKLSGKTVGQTASAVF
ncbi:hypothetical protein [Bacillus sp. V59.32b]|uniref:hypothetical protein n=1 Tax=Bacillus sp. V59.32b TaxID=1758642 RepID=UPI0020B160EB|nr:hypothetical protein [Bacillus sp. V59.32b]